MEEHRGMRACRSLKIGEAIMPPIQPIVFSLYRSKMGSHCSSCCKKGDPWASKLNKCDNTQCPMTYCSVGCKTNDCNAHILECELRRVLEKRSFVGIHDNNTGDLRLAVKILNLMEQNEGLGFLSEYEAADLIGNFGTQIDILQEVKERPVLLWKRILYAISINKVVLEDLVDEIGVGIFPKLVSSINHSCSPNVLLHVESEYFTDKWSVKPFLPGKDISPYRPCIVGIAIKEIEEGEEIFVSYTNLLQPRDLRQKNLREMYNISCLCERCFLGIDYILEKNTFCLSHGDLPEEMASTLFCLDNYEESRATLHAFLMHFLNGDPLNVKWVEKKISCNGCLRLHHHNYGCYLIYVKLIETLKKLELEKKKEQKDGEAFCLRKEAIAFNLLVAGLFNQLFDSDLAFIGFAARQFRKIGSMLIADTNESMPSKICIDETFPKTREVVMEAAKLFTKEIYCLVQGIWPTLIEDIPCLHGIEHPFHLNGLCGGSGLPNQDVSLIIRDLGVLCHKYGAFLFCLGYGQHSQVISKGQIETSKDRSDRKPVEVAQEMGRSTKPGDDEGAAKNVHSKSNEEDRRMGCSRLCWRPSWRET